MKPTSDAAISSFWGKARPDPDQAQRWHPLLWHMLDVAASAKAILAARPNARRTLSRFLALDEPTSSRLAVLVAALHDVGKFAAPFQQKATGPLWPFSVPPDAELGTSAHDRDGLALWRQLLAGEFGPRILPDAERTLEWLVTASVGHHGRAVDPAHRDLRATFQPEGLDAAMQCANILVELLLPEPIRLHPSASRRMHAASFWFAGFVTIADWVGSGKEYFPYTGADLAPSDYWQRAQAQAARAVGARGLVSARPSGPREFKALTGKSTPTPLQAFVENMDLGRGQVMIVIEDVTGAGKTEAAQVIVHRLMVGGRVAGAYWAMPTQATANAMYTRQSQSIAALFADDASPQLALAHGGAALHGKFRESVLRHAGRCETDFGSSDDGETATAACAAFLADDARAALIADVGAGTDLCRLAVCGLGIVPLRVGVPHRADRSFRWRSAPALARMFEHDRSAARDRMSTRRPYVFQHQSKLGHAPAHVLFDRLMMRRKADVAVPRGFLTTECSSTTELLSRGHRRCGCWRKLDPEALR